ncbi:hypothetical protein HQ544_02390 [Candidatus Falkowbacteria bacterium]|nr:hypothetical protein [Candidatus Falkowbacteria bacterium]
MKRNKEEYQRAIELRQKGYTLREISELLRISKSTASLWCRKTILSDGAKRIIKLKSEQGTARGLRTVQKNREKLRNEISSKVEKKLNNAFFNDSIYELLCSLIYICEGATDVNSGATFINSDPGLIQLYLFLLRKSFKLDEKKFRVCVHLHTYHEKAKQIKYWSKITKIPLEQFMKPHQKRSTGKRTKEGYQGCISIRYYDYRVAIELRSMYLVFLKKTGARSLIG